jgi:imidazolonepropionase-like amidohydrolase
MKTLFRRANVLTMKTDEVSYFTDLMVENGVIAIVGKNLPADGAEIIDCTGKYLMPGLFDAHAHLNTSEMCELFIANGITAIRHLSGEKRQMEYDAEIRAGKRVGPYIYSSGPIYDGVGAPEKLPNYVYISTLEEAEKAVYDTIDGGFRWVKTYPSITSDHLKRLMDTANSCGIKVCGHMSYFVDAKTLRDWGYHCCEHSSSLPRHDADIEYLAKSGMWFCPTQAVCETLPDYVWNGKKLSDVEHYEYVPNVLRNYWEERNRKIIAGYKKRDLRPDINIIINRGKKFMEFSDQYMAGSDTLYPGMVAGFSLHAELSKLVSLYGCTPFEALKAATVTPARYMGLEEEKGIIKKGMDADLLLLDKNPLADINNTRTIHLVMQGEKLYDHASLKTMLEHVRTISDDKLEFLSTLS